MRIARTALSLLLIALLGLTGWQVGAARALPGATAVESVVICRGHTIVTLHLDADGNPVERVHVCPDIALFVSGGEAIALPPPDAASIGLAGHAQPRALRDLSDIEASARDPPLSS